MARRAFRRRACGRVEALLQFGLYEDWQQECRMAALECELAKRSFADSWKHCLSCAHAALKAMGWRQREIAGRWSGYHRDHQMPTRIACFLLGSRRAPWGRRTVLTISS